MKLDLGNDDNGVVRSSSRDDLVYSPITRGERATRVLKPHTAQNTQSRGVGNLVTFANENLQNGENAAVQVGFETQDVAVAVLDIPSGYFPLEVKEVDVVWQSTFASPQQVATDILFYENGVLREVVSGAIMAGSGLMRIVIPSRYNMVFNEGTLSIGVRYHGTISGTVNSTLGHVVSAGTTSAECTPGANLVWNDAQAEWFDPCTLGMFGNFAIRAIVDPLCPAAGGGPRIGDINPDGLVDNQDWAILSGDLAGPNVVYGHGDFHRRSDLDTNGVVDLQDAAEFQRRFGDTVTCAAFPLFAGNDNATLADNSIFAADLEAARPSIELALAALDNGAFPDIRPELLRLPTHVAEDAHLRFTLVQLIFAFIILAILAIIVGSCISNGCRQLRKTNFTTQGNIMTSSEKNRLVQALDCLQQLGFNGDGDAETAWFWWAQAQAYNAHIFGNPAINRTADEEEIEFAATIILGQATIHHTFITGQNWTMWGKDSLVLLLFAEWQHVDCPTCSEEQLQPALVSFRQRNNLVNVAPEFGHGFGD